MDGRRGRHDGGGHPRSIVVSATRWFALLSFGASAPSLARATEQQVDAPAAPNAPAPPASPPAEELQKAKELFQRGNELRKSGDCQAALALYLASRELVPAAANTMNAAFCLHQLRREDEALDLYEELIGRFASDLSEQDRSAIAPAMVELRRSLGSLELSANVTGIVVVDGRMRGKLPLLAPVRLSAGRHVVRVLKDGYQTFEQTVESEPGKTQALDAVLTRLERSGGLRIECPDLPGAEVFIDGANLGVCPFEGALDPGSHLVWTRLGSRGSNPARVEVVLGQTTRAASPTSALGPELRFTVSPSTAELSLDGVALGSASFQGALTLGEHVFVAQEPGYRAQRVTASGERGGEVTLALEVDEAHPRWAKSEPEPAPGFFSLGADAAFMLMLTEGGDAAQSCNGVCEADVPLGVRGLLRAAWTSRMGLGVGVDVGGQFMRTSHEVRAIALEPVGLPERKNPGQLAQQLNWASFLVGASAFYRREGVWPITIGLGAGFSIGSVSAHREGDFTNSFGTNYAATQSDNSSATYVYLMPEAKLGRRLSSSDSGGPELTLGVSFMPYFAIAAPSWDNSAILPTSPAPEDRGDGGAVFAQESLMGELLLAGQAALGLRWEFR